jgi:hypothetical protein
VPDLEFGVRSARIEPNSLTPQLRFSLEMQDRSGTVIDSIVLAVQIMIEARKRSYDETEREGLLDLFGDPQRWGTTLKTMLWTHVSLAVPGFNGRGEAELLVPCTYDLSVAAAKYFFALADGEVPLTFQFSGTVFYRDEDGELRIARIPWTAEAPYRLPVSLWQELMRRQYPDCAFVPLRRDVVDELHRYGSRRGAGSLDAAVELLLREARVTR